MFRARARNAVNNRVWCTEDFLISKTRHKLFQRFIFADVLLRKILCISVLDFCVLVGTLGNLGKTITGFRVNPGVHAHQFFALPSFFSGELSFLEDLGSKYFF